MEYVKEKTYATAIAAQPQPQATIASNDIIGYSARPHSINGLDVRLGSNTHLQLCILILIFSSSEDSPPGVNILLW